jgi:hypothetical protein
MRGLAIALVLAGCTVSPQQQVEEVAEQYCACVLPGNKMCVSQFESFVSSVSDACTQCVFDHEHRCASMESDCTQLCVRNQTP